MHQALLRLSLVAALVAGPAALHADSLMTGQFSIQGTVTNDTTNSILHFDGPSIATGMGTQTGTFATLLTDGELLSSGKTDIPYNPYPTDFDVFTIGSLTVDLQTLTETDSGVGDVFTGMALLSAPGYLDTLANFSFTTQATGPVTFSATIITQGTKTTPTVPEPASLTLFGTGALALGLASKKFLGVSA